jgi:hypothetical protein
MDIDILKVAALVVLCYITFRTIVLIGAMLSSYLGV